MTLPDSTRLRAPSRRDLLRLGGAGLAAAGLAACGGSRRAAGPQTPAPSVSALQAPGTATTIDFWHGFTGPDGDVMNALVEQFNAEGTGVTVTVTTQAEYLTKLRAAAQSGGLPHVTINSADQLPQLAEDGIISQVDDLVGLLGVGEADFTATTWGANVWKDARYGIPFDVGPEAFYWNKDLFERAGLDPDLPPSGREELEEAARAIGREAGVPGLMVVTAGPGAAFLTGVVWSSLFYQGGGEWVGEDLTSVGFAEQAGVQAAELLQALVQDPLISPPAVQSDAEIAAFTQGENGMVMSGTWQLSRYAEALGDRLGAAPVPEVFGAGAWAGSQSLTVPQRDMSDDERQAAYYFHGWLSEHSLDWASSGALPARSEVRDSPQFAELEHVPDIAAGIDDMRFFPSFPGSGDLLFATGGAAEAVLTALGGADAATALGEAADRAVKVLERTKQDYDL